MATSIPTRSEPLTETIHGVEVADPYRWLENGDSDEVRSWTAQQPSGSRRWEGSWPRFI